MVVRRLRVGHGEDRGVATGERGAQTPNIYVSVDFGLNQMASMCEEEVVDKWQTVLAGVDVFTHSHCLRMVFHAMTE